MANSGNRKIISSENVSHLLQTSPADTHPAVIVPGKPAENEPRKVHVHRELSEHTRELVARLRRPVSDAVHFDSNNAMTVRVHIPSSPAPMI